MCRAVETSERAEPLSDLDGDVTTVGSASQGGFAQIQNGDASIGTGGMYL